MSMHSRTLVTVSAETYRQMHDSSDALGRRLVEDPLTRHHPDGRVTFPIDADTAARAAQASAPGETLGETIDRIVYAHAGKRPN
jgi:hypothetical protein